MKGTISILPLILFSAVYGFRQRLTNSNYGYFGYAAGLNFSKLQTVKDDSDRWTSDMLYCYMELDKHIGRLFYAG